MKTATFLLCTIILLPASNAVNPIEKVMEMCDDLLAKLEKEASEAESIYKELKLNCDDRAADLDHKIEVGTDNVEALNAAIEDGGARLEAGGTKVEELVTAISKADNELKDATAVREKENAAYVKKETELLETADMLTRAHGIIEREMNKGAFVQISGPNSFLKTIQLLVGAETLPLRDASKLTALLQEKSDSQDENEDDGAGAPDAEVYESKSGGILEAIADMKEKVEEELDSARKEETDNRHNFELLDQSLKTQMKNDGEDKDSTEQENLELESEKANNEDELAKAKAQLADNQNSLEKLRAKCVAAAENYEDERASRAAEIKAVTKAKKIIAETTSGASENAYGFLDLSSSSAPIRAMHLIKKLARADRSIALAQLVSRLRSTIELADSSSDVFAKVKGLIGEMIARLEKEGEESDAHHAYCVKEQGENEEKLAKVDAKLEKLRARRDSRTAKLAQLKEQVKELAKSLAQLEADMIKSTSIREEENALFLETEKDNKLGIKGVEQALKVLRDYYAKAADAAHDASDGASSGIISLLEVALEDFRTGLAEATEVEMKAAADYKKSIAATQVAQAAQKAEKEGKEKMIGTIKKDLLDLNNEIGNEEESQDALMKEKASLKADCDVKPESYEERAKRRAGEIDGLKKALEILEEASSASLVQTSAHKHLRG